MKTDPQFNVAMDWIFAKLKEIEIPCSIKVLYYMADQDRVEASRFWLNSALWHLANEDSIKFTPDCKWQWAGKEERVKWG